MFWASIADLTIPRPDPSTLSKLRATTYILRIGNGHVRDGQQATEHVSAIERLMKGIRSYFRGE